MMPKYGNWAGCRNRPGSLLKIQMFQVIPSENRIHQSGAGLQAAVVLVSTQFRNPASSTPFPSSHSHTGSWKSQLSVNPTPAFPLPHPTLLTQLGQY